MPRKSLPNDNQARAEELLRKISELERAYQGRRASPDAAPPLPAAPKGVGPADPVPPTPVDPFRRTMRPTPMEMLLDVDATMAVPAPLNLLQPERFRGRGPGRAIAETVVELGNRAIADYPSPKERAEREYGKLVEGRIRKRMAEARKPAGTERKFR
jgi:hypothetical protein